MPLSAMKFRNCRKCNYVFVETFAVIAHLLPDHLRGSGFGVLGAVQATGDLVATVVAGILYTLRSPTVAFGYAAAWMLGSVAASGALRPPHRELPNT